MCDTQVLLHDDGVYFAKNSDREPSEPHVVQRIEAVQGDTAANVRTSYLEIEQVPDRQAVILCKPNWIWGGEMGVNAAGVMIGNEAVFSREVSREPALLGMDLVRLGLERADSADQAVHVMTESLERYGQGGAAGFRDKGFCYDNSYIIADRCQAWVLETAGRHWVARPVQRFAAISNQLSIGEDYTRSSASVDRIAGRRGKIDFARRFDTWLMPYFGRSAQRRELSMQCLERSAANPSLAAMAQHLRAHLGGDEDPARGSNADLCLHATGYIRRSQTTGSMVAYSGPDGPRIAATGTSAPCLSIFRPVGFSGGWSVLTPQGQEAAAPLWSANERLHRRALFDALLRDEIRRTRDEVEAAVLKALHHGDTAALQDADAGAFQWHQRRLQGLGQSSGRRPSRYWRRLNQLDGFS